MSMIGNIVAAPLIPPGHDYSWSQWLLATSSALIGLTYFTICIALLLYLRKRKEPQYRKLFGGIAIFALASGVMHLLEIWDFGRADHWLPEAIKVVTALAAVPMVILLIRLMPKALALPNPADLKKAYDELEQRVAERTRQLEIANETLRQEARERQRAEQESRESEIRMRAVIDSTLNAVVVVDSHGKISDWNARAETIFGWSRAEALGRDLTETIIPHRHQAGHQHGMKHYLATGAGPVLNRMMELSALRRDGSEFPVELFISPLKSGDTIRFCGFITDITARKEAERNLRESQHLLQTVIDNSPAVIFVKDPQGRYLLVNRRFCEIFQRQQPEVIGKTDHDLFPNADADAYRAMDQRVMAANRALTEEESAPLEDGLHTYISVKCPLSDDAGRVYALLGVSTDITESKHAQERAVWLGSFPELNPNPIVELDFETGVIHYANPCAATLFPDLKAQSLRHPILAGLQEIAQKTNRAAPTPVRREVSAGQDHYSQTITYIPESRRFRVYSTIITERKLAEEWLKAALKETGDLRAAMDEHAIVAITDPQGRINYVNDAFCAISKYPRVELLGQDHRLINSGHHPKKFFRDLWTTISNGKVWKGEIRNRAKDGTFYWVATTIVPFLDEAGKPRQYIAIRADITEHKVAEEQIRSLNAELEQRVVERTAELESFSYSVSHDLRAPLRAMNGYARLLQEDLDDNLPPEAARKLTRIQENTNQMGLLIDGLLAFSRLSRQQLEKKTISTTQLTNRALEALHAEQADRQIQIIIGDLPNCLADATLLQQVFTNLISNALKYTRHRAQAVIEVGWDQTQQAYFVKDNGAGFEMKYAGKLFGVFQRLHRQDEFEGTGVGLAIVQRIIFRHGGKIWAQSELDKGAIFYFTIADTNSQL